VEALSLEKIVQKLAEFEIFMPYAHSSCISHGGTSANPKVHFIVGVTYSFTYGVFLCMWD